MVTSIHQRAASPDLLEPLLGVLGRYVSMPNAHSIVKLARRRTPGCEGRIDQAALRAMLESIEHNLRLYVVDGAKRTQCSAALRALLEGAPEAPERLVMEIRTEDDIARARTASRELAAYLGFSPAGQTRLVTIVSELARNIVQYAREGRVELKRVPQPPAVEITASDAGPGIPNLEEIFSGRYKSKLGMGLGLLGVKRLAQSFDIRTGALGTTVVAVLRVL